MKASSLKKSTTIVFIFILFLVFFSCRKNLVDNTSDGSKLDIQSAISYYSELVKNDGEAVKVNSLNTLNSLTKPNKKYVLFKKAYESETDKAWFVELPLLYNKRTSSIIGKKTETDNLNSSLQLLNSSFDRLILYKNKQTLKIEQLIVTYIPNQLYLSNHHNDASRNKINHIERDFSGYIAYRTWDEKPLYILKIENGKSVKRLIPKKSSLTVSKVSSKSIKTFDMSCEDIYQYIFQQQCWYSDPEHTQNEECGDWELVETNYAGQDCQYELPNPEGDPCMDPWDFNPACFQGGNVQPELPHDPCGEAQRLALNQVFKSDMLDLKNKTNLDYESGYFKSLNNNAGLIQGEPGTLSLPPFPINMFSPHSVERMMHNHYSAPGSYSIFSGADINFFSQLVGSGKTISNFTLSVTTSQGFTYAYIIEDQQKFDSFFDIYGSGTGPNLLIAIFDGAADPNTHTPTQAESGVVQFLNLLNSGIALLKSNNDFTHWDKFRIDSNNNLVLDSCN